MNDARGPFADFFGRLWRQKPLGIASGIVILILILLAIFADVLAPYPFDQLNLADRLQGPSARHLLGTDQLGRDLLSRLLFGARILPPRQTNRTDCPLRKNRSAPGGSLRAPWLSHPYSTLLQQQWAPRPGRFGSTGRSAADGFTNGLS